jgi:hypothetical protein
MVMNKGRTDIEWRLDKGQMEWYGGRTVSRTEVQQTLDKKPDGNNAMDSVAIATTLQNTHELHNNGRCNTTTTML